VTDDEEFSAFVRLRSGDLQRMAWLLTGDWASAQDLVQSALVKTWQRWRSVRRRDAPEAYVRRVMLTTFLSWRRRRWSGEVPVGWSPGDGYAGSMHGAGRSAGDAAAATADHVAVVAALRRLPRQQRAVVVLRYVADLSEQATADALGCSVGTVKSHHARALSALRANDALRAAIVEGSR
jgi:RNA polymerase sigma-70 factor (sigma-E family)